MTFTSFLNICSYKSEKTGHGNNTGKSPNISTLILTTSLTPEQPVKQNSPLIHRVCHIVHHKTHLLSNYLTLPITYFCPHPQRKSCTCWKRPGRWWYYYWQHLTISFLRTLNNPYSIYIMPIFSNVSFKYKKSKKRFTKLHKEPQKRLPFSTTEPSSLAFIIDHI